MQDTYGLSMVQGKFIEAQDLPEGEKVYLRKDRFGWRMVKPIKNPDGSFNWPNLLFGGWRNLLMLLFILAVVLLHLHEDKLNLESAKNSGINECMASLNINISRFAPPDIVYNGYGGVLMNADG